jgi:hypothetical protein
MFQNVRHFSIQKRHAVEKLRADELFLRQCALQLHVVLQRNRQAVSNRSPALVGQLFDFQHKNNGQFLRSNVTTSTNIKKTRDIHKLTGPPTVVSRLTWRNRFCRQRVLAQGWNHSTIIAQGLSATRQAETFDLATRSQTFDLLLCTPLRN